MSYRVRIYCRDCTDQDPMGCFDGGTDIVCERAHPFAVREFATVAEAEAAGWDEVENCGPWEFEVIDRQDKVVADSVRMA